MQNIQNLAIEQMIELHSLASLAIETTVNKGIALTWKQLHLLVPTVLHTTLKQSAGTFVTLKKLGNLRGCIGYIFPVKPLYQAVMENGVNAAMRDTRFAPVQPDELTQLKVEVSVLTVPTTIPSYTYFSPGLDGIIMNKGHYSAVFLPEVAFEQGWSREQTFTHLSRKAGLPDDAWQEGATFQTFRSQQYTSPIKITKI